MWWNDDIQLVICDGRMINNWLYVKEGWHTIGYMWRNDDRVIEGWQTICYMWRKDDGQFTCLGWQQSISFRITDNMSHLEWHKLFQLQFDKQNVSVSMTTLYHLLYDYPNLYIIKDLWKHLFINMETGKSMFCMPRIL